MDIQEATKRVMTSIQRLDPENTTRIMGYIMIQDQGEMEMIRLAFFSDTALLSYINQAKLRLGIITSNSSGGGNPCSNSSTVHANDVPFPQPPASPKVVIPSNGFHLPKPSSPFSRTSPRQPLSYASVLNGSSPQVATFSGPGSPALPFYGGGSEFQGDGHAPYFDDSVVDPIMSPSGRSDSVLFPYGGGGGEDVGNGIVPPFHRRSCSVNDAAFFEDSVGGFDFGRRCMYFSKGNCRNGSACKFSHGEFSGGEGFEVGSPSKTGSGFDDLLRIKALQQRFALMGSSGGHHNPFSPHNRCMSFLDGNPRRNDFSHMGFGNVLSSSARQIYLTFPADSTFKEEDVTNYFSTFGPVHDVRIPYQQKRMFGFVSFVYPETVKLILAKGNPHFVCDSRVLVKPYKEKGKILDKKNFHQQHWEKSDYSRELYDLPVGPRMLNSQEMVMRRKFEQEAELHHAIERESLKMMNLQLMELNHHHNHQHHQQQHNYNFPRGFPTGIFASSPRESNHNVAAPSAADAFTQGELDDVEDDKKPGSGEAEYFSNNRVGGGESCLPESGFEHVLPDNPFTSPRKSDASTGNSNGESATFTSFDEKAPISGNSAIFR